ncbi:DUF4912 domain-containing protein, partial [bacterium]|nr:DUF4912 domain-containing protein [bacterium]
MNIKIGDLHKKTQRDLYELAKKLNIRGRSSLSKDQLVRVISSEVVKAKRTEEKVSKPRSHSVPDTSLIRSLPKKTGTPKKAETRSKIASPLDSSVSEAPITPKTFHPYKPLPKSPSSESRLSGEVPLGYGDNKIVLQIRDPYWAHSYWESSSLMKTQLRQKLTEDGYNRSRFILRVYDISNVNFNGSNQNSFYDIPIFESATNWYIHLGRPNRKFVIDLGLISPNGEFLVIAPFASFSPFECWILPKRH